MLIDVGMKKLVEGNRIAAVSLNLKEAILVQSEPISPQPPTRIKLSIHPQALVERLGGAETFATLVYPEGGVAWFRRSMIRGVYPIPSPIAEEYGEGSLMQMEYDEPMPEPWPPKRRMWPAFSASVSNMSVDELQQMLDDRNPVLPVHFESSGAVAAPPTTEQLSTALASSPLVGAAENITALARPQWFALEASEAEASSFLLDPSGAVSGPTPAFALDLAEANADLGLPRQGALIFSYDAYSKPWGDEPADAGSFSVMLSQASAREEAEASGLRSVAIRLVEGIGLPAIDSLPGELLPIDSDDEAEAYLELLEELFGEPGSPGGAPGTWLLGYPYQLQDDMQEQCAEMAKSAWGLESEPAEWRLLLQLASESAANMCWEDDGFLYYWIRESDLAKHDFSHVWCILQTM